MSELHLVLKSKWFEMIDSGVKKEEYRDIKDYWTKRLYSKFFDVLVFHKGYTNTTMRFRLETITAGYGNPDWGAPITRTVYILKLGKRL